MTVWQGGMQILQILINNKIRLETKDLPETVVKKLESQLTFRNPKWIENKKRRRWNGETPEYLSFIEQDGDSLTIPRGFITKLKWLFDQHGIRYQIEDLTRKLSPVDFRFTGNLYAFQAKAVQDILSRRFGVLQSPTGSGKTIIALNVIAKRRQPALIIVHGKELMNQWKERAVEFLDITEDEIGLIGDGKSTIGDRLTIGIINSLYKCADDIRDRFGFLVVDECHRTPARTFTDAVGAFDSCFTLGLSATPYRRDGLTKVIYFHLGERVHEIKEKKLQETKKIMTPTLEVRETNFDFNYQDNYQDMLSALTEDLERNKLIVQDVISHTRQNNGISLVVSDRKSHCGVLHEMISKKGVSTLLLTGSTAKKERKAIVEKLQDGKIKVLISTSQLIGEGFDLKSLSAIFLCTPVKFTGRVKQYVGRILRTAAGKRKAVIFDYVDAPGVLRASFRSRENAYRELGIGKG